MRHVVREVRACHRLAYDVEIEWGGAGYAKHAVFLSEKLDGLQPMDSSVWLILFPWISTSVVTADIVVVVLVDVLSRLGAENRERRNITSGLCFC